MDFDDFSDLFDDDGDDGDGGDDGAASERAGWADELGAVPDRDMGELSNAQWQAAFGEYIDSGQISQEQVDAVLAADDAYFEEWGELIVDIETDSPDGDTP